MVFDATDVIGEENEQPWDIKHKEQLPLSGHPIMDLPTNIPNIIPTDSIVGYSSVKQLGICMDSCTHVCVHSSAFYTYTLNRWIWNRE